jgi:hypothetical protein
MICNTRQVTIETCRDLDVVGNEKKLAFPIRSVGTVVIVRFVLVAIVARKKLAHWYRGQLKKATQQVA